MSMLPNRARNALFALLLVSAVVRADAIVDWNVIAGNMVTDAAMGTPPANRVLAIAHTAADEALEEVAKDAQPAFVDAVVASAFRRTLAELVPSRAEDVEDAYRRQVSTLEPKAARKALAIGERAAAAVLKRRASDSAAQLDDFRVEAPPGTYVPTTATAAPNWSLRSPWHLPGADALRPPPPAALDSDTWARDYEESRLYGGQDSTVRSQEQTAAARFWEATLPPIYHALARTVARRPGRTTRQNARLFARVTQAMDDALIAVFEAKYHYRFWRPVTAIRNGDRDGNDRTVRDARWSPLIETPMHPEYPCAHCAVSAAIATVLKPERAAGADAWATTSTFAGNAERRWPDLDAFVHEVSEARIMAGVHYRFSADAGRELGQKVGEAVLKADARETR